MMKLEDPVVPTVTFDSYVRPETVKQKAHVRTVIRARYQAIMQQRAEAAAEKPAATSQEPAPSPLAQFVSDLRTQAARLRMPQIGRPAAIAGIAVLTFALGIAATLLLVGSSQIAEGQRTDAQEVTRQQSPDLMSTTAVQNPQTDTALTAAEPAARAETPLIWLSDDDMTRLKGSVLAGRYTIAKAQTADIPRLALKPGDAELTRAATASLAEAAAGQDDAPILLSFRTPDGQIDTDTMLFSLIQTSLLRDGTAESTAAAREMRRRVFAASDATTQRIDGARTYQVRPGDSLAAIAMQFYGRPDAYPRILAANGETMTSPDEIRTGQHLIIPIE